MNGCIMDDFYWNSNQSCHFVILILSSLLKTAYFKRFYIGTIFTIVKVPVWRML
jgi:hypothetical protein